MGLITTEGLLDNRCSPRTESIVAAAVQWANRSMKKTGNAFDEGLGVDCCFYILAADVNIVAHE